MHRLFGLTPIIMTNCTRPTQLLLWPHLNYTVFLGPAFVFLLYWFLATDFRMWMFTPVSCHILLTLRTLIISMQTLFMYLVLCTNHPLAP